MAKDAEYLRAKSTLKSWNFIKEYNKNKEKYKEVAQIALVTLESSGEKVDEDSDARTYVQYVSAALQYTNLWYKALQSKKFLRPNYRLIMSEMMALYILEENWPIIS